MLDKMVKNYISLYVLVLLLGTAGAYAECPVQCPTPGDLSTLNQFILDCKSCECQPLTNTCNNEYSITVSEATRVGSEVTYNYEICRPEGSKDLGNFTVDLTQIDCLEVGKTLEDLVVAASVTVPGDPPVSGGTYTVTPELGLDPPTQLVGVKIELTAEQRDAWPQETCATLSFSLDEAAIESGYQLALAGCGVVATKAGNQDIRNPGKLEKPSPGYACIKSPICVEAAESAGCTPGFWKNHTAGSPSGKEAWTLTGYDPSQLVSSVFTEIPQDYSTEIGGSTLLEALSFTGGEDLDGAARILLRAAVAALLNAAYEPPINYPLDETEITDQVHLALGFQDRDAILALAEQLDMYNNLGCPIFADD